MRKRPSNPFNTRRFKRLIDTDSEDIGTRNKIAIRDEEIENLYQHSENLQRQGKDNLVFRQLYAEVVKVLQADHIFEVEGGAKGWTIKFIRQLLAKENWSSKYFYFTMRWVFRERKRTKPWKQLPLTPPFLTNRPLSRKEFNGASELYLRANIDKYITSLHERPSRQSTPNAESSWPPKLRPALTFFSELPWVQRLKYEVPIMRLLFADTPLIQQKARKALNDLIATASPTMRPILAQAKRAIPQARRKISRMPIKGQGYVPYLDFLTCRAQQLFQWKFLRHEALAFRDASLGEIRDIAKQVAPLIAEKYGYLSLQPDAIPYGLVNPEKQADIDTADEFVEYQLSPASIRPLISKYKNASKK